MQKILLFGSCLTLTLLTISCDKPPATNSSEINETPILWGQGEKKVLTDTIAELRSVNDSIDKAVKNFANYGDVEMLIADIQSVYPRLELVEALTTNLTDEAKMVVRGEMVVVTNRFKGKLDSIQKSEAEIGGLIGEIEYLKYKLSPSRIL